MSGSVSKPIWFSSFRQPPTCLARAAHGMADDLLTNVLLTARGPVVFAPAMHSEMWNHPATQANVATLRSRGALVIEPAVGRLTGSDSGVGRLPEPADIVEFARRVLARGEAGLRPDLVGRRVVVSAGGTREALDPVRFIGNRSSGRQGYALAMTAVARGAEVTLVSANVALPDPAGAKVVRVVSADELRSAVLEAATRCRRSRDGRGGRRLPAGHHLGVQDQEVGRRPAGARTDSQSRRAGRTRPP